MTADPMSSHDDLTVDVIDRLEREVGTAMLLAKEHGFRRMLALSDPPGGERVAVGRRVPGECYQIIIFRGLQAQAVRADEFNVAMIDPDATDAGVSVYTGYALEVVKDLLNIKED